MGCLNKIYHTHGKFRHGSCHIRSVSPAEFSRTSTQSTIAWDSATPTPSKKAKSSPPLLVPTAAKSGCKRELFGADMPRPTSKATLSKPLVPVKLEQPRPSSVPRAELPKAAAPPPPSTAKPMVFPKAAPTPVLVPKAAPKPAEPTSAAEPVLVPKAAPKLASPPCKSILRSPADAQQATPRTPCVTTKKVTFSPTPPGNIKTARPLPASEPDKRIEQPAEVSRTEQVYDELAEKTEDEIDKMIADARKQPEFPKYLKWLEQELGVDDADTGNWGTTEPVDELVDFVVWAESHQNDSIKAEQQPATPAPPSKKPAPPIPKPAPSKPAQTTRPKATAPPTPQETQTTPKVATQSAQQADDQKQPSSQAGQTPPPDRVRVADTSKVGLFL